MYSNGFVIAIDGGCRTSKSRLSKGLSDLFQVPFLDSGLLYRAFADFWRNEQFSSFLGKPIAFYKQYSRIEIKCRDDECFVYVNGTLFNPGKDKHDIDMLTSQIAEDIPVRLYLTEIIHNFVADSRFIVAGRDIGTFVFPKTRFKVFLTQSYSYNDIGVTKQKVIAERDHRDSNRSFSPMRQAQNQLLLDTSLNTFEENLLIIKNYIINEGWI